MIDILTRAFLTTSNSLWTKNLTLSSASPVIKEKGGDPELVRESQRKRGASVELVDNVIARYAGWVKRKCWKRVCDRRFGD